MRSPHEAFKKSQETGGLSNNPQGGGPTPVAPRGPTGSHPRAEALPIVAAVALGLGVLASLALDDPRLRFPAHLAAVSLASLGWLVLAAGARAPTGRRELWALGVALHAAAIALPPAFSEDVFRYLYEGRVAWWGGPGFAWTHPPADALRLGVPAEVRGDGWWRINHAGIPTLYPPLAQLTFGAAARFGDGLVALKLALVGAALAGALLLDRSVARGTRWAPLVFACPPLVLEIGREGHADALPFLGFAAFVAGFAGGRPRLGHLGVAVAILGKLAGAILVPLAIRASRRGAGIALAGLALSAVPIALAGSAGTIAYATRWRAFDGLFAGGHALAERLLGGDYATVLGRTITADELARGIAGLGLFAVGAALTLPRVRPEEAPARGGALVLALLLLSPTLHPWYPLWLLPFVPALGPLRPAALALVLGAQLFHVAPYLELTSGRWAQPGWARLVVHGATLGLLAAAAIRHRSAVRGLLGWPRAVQAGGGDLGPR